MELINCFKRGLLINIPADIESAGRSIKLARSYLADAENSLIGNSYRLVAISSYTAMFHAARAILFRDGVKERSHECISLYLRENYPALAGQANMLDSYRKYRHEALYGLEFEAGKEDAIASLTVANGFLSAIENVLETS